MADTGPTAATTPPERDAAPPSDVKVDEKLPSYDAEKGGDHGAAAGGAVTIGRERVVVNQSLQRGLKSRHIQMISIGGVIGTGLFLGTAKSLHNGGPLGLWLGYIIVGSFAFATMQALGEMIAHLPVAGGHLTLANRFGDAALSFSMSWNYWYNWTIVLPAELSAAAVLVGYWDQEVNPAAWISIFLVTVIAINLGGARVYGEFEFWFALIKVITIIGLIILAIVVTSGGGPSHEAIGFRYWNDPGPFQQYLDIQGAKGRFLGFFSVLINAAFAYVGVEIVGIAAGESRNPRKSLPKAIRRVFFRIIVFYLLGTFLIGLICDPNDPRLDLNSTAAGSPWVISIQNAGISGLPSVINAALLTSATSAASSDMYTSSRALFAMSIQGNAPRFLSRVNSWGLPYLCLVVSCAFALLAYMAAGSDTAGKVFGYFANMTSVCGLITWVGILYTYVRFYKGLKVQGIDRKTLPYTAPLQPYLSYYALVGICIVLFFNNYSVFLSNEWDTGNFITSYLPLPMAFILYFGYKFYYKTTMVRYTDMDFYTGQSVDEPEEERKPRNIAQRFWAWLM